MKKYGETFDIRFDLILHKKKDWKPNDCSSLVYVEYNEDLEGKDYEEKASIYLCRGNTLAFEVTKNGSRLEASNDYPVTPNVEHHIQYKQFRQHDYNGELKRFVKIDNEIVFDRQVNFTLVDATVHVGDVDPYGSISNFKMSK